MAVELGEFAQRLALAIAFGRKRRGLQPTSYGLSPNGCWPLAFAILPD